MFPVLALYHLSRKAKPESGEEGDLETFLVPDADGKTSCLVSLGIFALPGGKERVKGLKLVRADAGYPLHPFVDMGIVVRVKYLTNHSLSFADVTQQPTCAAIELLRAHIVKVSGHVPNGKRR